MYLRILKKDLQRKRTMNMILLIFVILAATFIASSANNLLTVSRALDSFLEKANAPDNGLVPRTPPMLNDSRNLPGIINMTIIFPS